jgi:hypothetical protein
MTLCDGLAGYPPVWAEATDAMAMQIATLTAAIFILASDRVHLPV